MIAALKDYLNWWHQLDSTWLIKTEDTHVAVRDHLKKFIDKGDELLVMDVTGATAAWTGFSDKGSSWIKTNL